MESRIAVELDGQYRALREEAGLLERARGKLFARGADAADFLQGQLTNEVAGLEPGDGCYAALLDRKGHVQADVRVLRLGPDELWLDCEPSGAAALVRHLSTYRIGRDVELEDAGDGWTVLSVIGPAAGEVAGSGPLAPEHAHREHELDGVACRVVATDLGLDLVCAVDDAPRLAASLRDRGAAPVDEPAAEIARVESGRPRFGHEMTTATIPQEAAIEDRAVSFTKGCYIGQETVARLHYKGRPNRRLRGLRLDAPVADREPIRLGEREVGEIGTAVLSPTLGPIALAVIRREAESGDRVEVGPGGIGAEVVELPFPGASSGA